MTSHVQGALRGESGSAGKVGGVNGAAVRRRAEPLDEEEGVVPDWIEYRKGVPGGSKVEVVANTSKKATVSVAIVSTGDDDGQLAPEAVEPGPGPWKIVAPEVYLFKARIAFVQKGSATVEMRIRKPNGDEHSKPARWEANGDTGDVSICSLIVQSV